MAQGPANGEGGHYDVLTCHNRQRQRLIYRDVRASARWMETPGSGEEDSRLGTNRSTRFHTRPFDDDRRLRRDQRCDGQRFVGRGKHLSTKQLSQAGSIIDGREQVPHPNWSADGTCSASGTTLSVRGPPARLGTRGATGESRKSSGVRPRRQTVSVGGTTRP